MFLLLLQNKKEKEEIVSILFLLRNGRCNLSLCSASRRVIVSGRLKQPGGTSSSHFITASTRHLTGDLQRYSHLSIISAIGQISYPIETKSLAYFETADSREKSEDLRGFRVVSESSTCTFRLTLPYSSWYSSIRLSSFLSLSNYNLQIQTNKYNTITYSRPFLVWLYNFFVDFPYPCFLDHQVLRYEE